MAFTGEEPGRAADSIRTQQNDSQLPKPCIHIRVGIVGVGITGVGIAGAPRDEIRKYILREACKYNHFADALARRPISVAYTFSGRRPIPR